MSRHPELDVTTIFDDVLDQISITLHDALVCLHLHDSDDDMLKLVASRGVDPIRIRSWSKLATNGCAPQALTHRSQEALELSGPDAPGGLSGLICLPLKGLDVQIGVLSVFWSAGQQVEDDPDRLAFLATMAVLLTVAVEHHGLIAEMIDNLSRILELKSQAEARSKDLDDLNVRLREANNRLTELSITDGLTGLFNHRYTHQRIEEEIRRCQRMGTPLCLIMADLDHFKRLNDSLGHLAGDEALRLFAQWLRSCVRATDLVGRMGGEEFTVLLLDCDLEQGLLVAEKIRATVEANSMVEPFVAIGGFQVSLGVAQLRQDQDMRELVDETDKALYQAKRGGRNRVCVAPAQGASVDAPVDACS